MGEKNNNCWIRWNLTYASDSDWIFFTKIIFNIDGEKYEKTFSDFEPQREVVLYGALYEKVDIPYEENIELVNKIIKSKKTLVRFQGANHSADRVVSVTQKQAMQRIIYLCDLIKSN